jgi:hypothetical protein
VLPEAGKSHFSLVYFPFRNSSLIGNNFSGPTMLGKVFWGMSLDREVSKSRTGKVLLNRSAMAVLTSLASLSVLQCRLSPPRAVTVGDYLFRYGVG